MLRLPSKSKSAGAVLSLAVSVATWGNAMAGVFCPHLMGSSDSCLMLKAKAHHPPDRVSDSDSSMARDSVDHSHMTETDMQNVPMNMSDLQMSDLKMDHTTPSPPKIDPELLSNGAPEIRPNKELTAETITQPHEPCSHCLIHLRSSTNVPLRVAVQANASDQLVAADTGATIVKGVPSSLTFVELHDHSPPGSQSPLYILVSAFRI